MEFFFSLDENRKGFDHLMEILISGWSNDITRILQLKPPSGLSCGALKRPTTALMAL